METLYLILVRAQPSSPTSFPPPCFLPSHLPSFRLPPSPTSLSLVVKVHRTRSVQLRGEQRESRDVVRGRHLQLPSEGTDVPCTVIYGVYWCVVLVVGS